MTLYYPHVVTGAHLLQSTISLQRLAPLLSERGARFVGVVHPTLYGIKEIYETLRAVTNVGIGLEVVVEHEGYSYKVYVYAKDEHGYQSLVKMSSAVMMTEDKKIPFRWFQAYRKHCITVIPWEDATWQNGGIDSIYPFIDEGNSYIAMSRSFIDEAVEEEVELVSEQYDLPIIAWHTARYIERSERASYDILQMIDRGETVSTYVLEEKDESLLEEEEFLQRFNDQPKWLENLATFAERCTLHLTFHQKPILPVYPKLKEEEKVPYLVNVVQNRLKQLNKWNIRYEERMRDELEVIQQMGFVDYFLIVSDIVRFAESEHILTGPGRGSSASSLIAYGLHITDVDPLEHDLLFDRFLNRERVHLPDIDVDFEDYRRTEILKYIERTYGKERVAQIATFGTMTMKSVLRNVFRVYECPKEEVDALMALVEESRAKTVKEAVQYGPIRTWIQANEQYVPLIEHALVLEGFPRNVSTHAAGIVIAKDPLVPKIPVERGNDVTFMTQWAMDDVERSGFVKFDILGLTNLTLLRNMIQYIAPQQSPKQFLEQIPLDDEKTFELFQRGETDGIFQFESRGMKEALQLVQPTTFAHLYAVNALYRPGPMESIPLYAARKNGEQSIPKTVPLLDEVLRETYGLFVYQEQVMQVAVRIGGFRFSEADLFRRALMENDQKKMNQFYEKFMQGARTQGYTDEQSVMIFEEMRTFAQYSFPKGHAVAYSKIAYWLAYLNVHYPAAFYAANLSASVSDDIQSARYVLRAKERGIQFLPPSAAFGRGIYEVIDERTIRTGLYAVKYLPKTFYTHLWEKRDEWKAVSPKTFFDWTRLMKDELTEERLIHLIDAGAFDDFQVSRDVLRASVEVALQDARFPMYGHPKFKEPKQQRSMIEIVEAEKEVLPFYISDHPVAIYREEMKKDYMRVIELLDFVEGTPIQLYGKVEEVRTLRTKKGEEMAFMEVSDETGSIECTIFPRIYKRWTKKLYPDLFVEVVGKVDVYRGMKKVVVDQLNVYEKGLPLYE